MADSSGGTAVVTATDSSASAAGAAAGSTGTRATNRGPTPYTLFMHDDAYGNISIGALAVDQTHIYFGENGGRLLRRRIDGSDKSVLFGEWTGTLLGAELALDQDYVYWLDNGQLVRAPKAGGASETIVLDGQTGDIVATESHVYVASDGCLSIVRIAHGTVEKEVLKAPESVTRPGGGFTYLLLDGSDLYCANGPRIFVSHNWGPMEILTSDAGQPVVGMAVVDKVLYWLSGSLPIKFYRYSKDRPATLLNSLNYTLISRYVVSDPQHKRLLFTSGASVGSLSTETGEWKKLLVTQAGYAVARDGSYFYWGREAFTESSIERMPLTQE